jgi:aminodeoxyfutalosine deaminase
VRQFGGAAAMEVARLAARMKPQGVVAFGLGGDELSLPAEEFRGVYDFARAQGLRCLAHAGEVGGPQSVGDAVEILGAERIGHGIAASAAGEVTSMLAERRIPVEICPTSNLRTGALARLLANPRAKIEQHPVRGLFDHGVPVTISTDDPAMFHTSLLDEYVLLERLGFTRAEIARVARASFEAAFLDAESKAESLKRFDEAAAAAGLV